MKQFINVYTLFAQEAFIIGIEDGSKISPSKKTIRTTLHIIAKSHTRTQNNGKGTPNVYCGNSNRKYYSKRQTQGWAEVTNED